MTQTPDLIRIDICHGGDGACESRLLVVIAFLGGRCEDDWHESELGVGVQRFYFEAGELSVYKDAWGTDVAGPEKLVRRVLAGMAGG